jgi:F-type H+-transporting ATPase subunit b
MEALGKLGIDWKILLLQIANFVILLYLLNRFLYKPILKLFRDRSTKIEAGLKTADDLKRQAAESETRQRQFIEEAKKEARRIVEHATKLGDDEKKKIIEMANDESRRIVERAMLEIGQEKKNIMNVVKKEVGELVVALSVSMVKKTIDEKAQKQLLDEAVKEVERELEKATRKN